MLVEVAVTATADEKNSRFQGEVTVSGAVFSYDLNFMVPIDDLTDTLRGKTTDEFRKSINIRIRITESELTLENDEWRLFYYLLMPSILKIHNTRVQFRQARKPSGSIVLAEGGPIDLKPEAVHILARPKFACQLMNMYSDSRQKSN
jgi:hypothetical protein